MIKFLAKLAVGMNPIVGTVATVATGGMNMMTPTPPQKIMEYGDVIEKAKSPEGKEFAMKMAESMIPSRRARRFIAQVVTLTWVVYLILPIIWEMIGQEPLQSIEHNSAYIHGVFGTILAFYFLGSKESAVGGIVSGLANLASNSTKTTSRKRKS